MAAAPSLDNQAEDDRLASQGDHHSREIDLTHERPTARAGIVSLEPDKIAVSLGNRLINLVGAVEVKGELHRTVNVAILCLTSLATAGLTAVVCRYAQVPYWWLTLLSAVLLGAVVFAVGLRQLRSGQDHDCTPTASAVTEASNAE
ncbi:hypothetical protein O7623_19990 [Solwaraspora sp. WMMD791]|uniref:hypothetical protein n=1 Tax=Solwaraspora sp. WMMD791 TaxID=3016086 RepID=UPI00249C23EC|nr:hypothetical protein [Solwaraspora sp. WMMD791]WFE25650.1 hypothetical protein O7623_19990 [Solwaraspora sp. WMMD791]